MSSKEGHSLPKLTLRDFCFNKLNEDDEKLRKNPLSMPKLYTVAQSLQDAYVYRNLKPELGSLGEFLGGTLQLRHEKKYVMMDVERKTIDRSKRNRKEFAHKCFYIKGSQKM